MRIDPQIAALQRDPAAQRALGSVIAQARKNWLGHHAVRELLENLHAFGTGRALADLPDLHDLVSDAKLADSFVDAWIDALAEPLRSHPLGEIPFAHSYSHGLATMRIADSGGTSLSLVCYEEVPPSNPPQTAFFSDREQYEIVLAGAASGCTFALAEASEHGQPVCATPQQWRRGDVIAVRPNVETREVLQVERRFVVLRLERTPANPAPGRVIALGDGSLLRQVSGSKRASQLEMAVTVLGAMGRKDALPAICAIAHDGPAHLRWEALRHALA
ncbi:MAG: hypothetical protein A3J40_11290, partial [Erythrobacter sp. RIFCSPHIGHO2_12_FULL_63_10]